MFQSFFDSFSGMMSFSQYLNTISNNISNMNTPGFRGSDVFLRGIAGSGNNGGDGTELVDVLPRQYQGSIKQTGNPSDLALNGSGFFILRDSNGNNYYTRGGQFRFNNKGYLVDQVTGYRVAGIDASGNLTDINISNLKTLPAAATTTVNFKGNLSDSDSVYNVNNIKVYDSSGTVHTLKAVFTNNDAQTQNSWVVNITDSNGNIVGTGTIKFANDGTPKSGANTVTVTLGSGSTSQKISMNFGSPGSYTGATELGGTGSTLGATVADGHGESGLVSYSFDNQGVMQLKYSDGEKKQGPQVGLAWFQNQQGLKSLGGSLFTTSDPSSAKLGRAGKGVFGTIQGGSLELSNVNLSQEFSNLILAQRGYQASAQVMTAANKMISQLYTNMATMSRGG